MSNNIAFQIDSLMCQVIDRAESLRERLFDTDELLHGYEKTGLDDKSLERIKAVRDLVIDYAYRSDELVRDFRHDTQNIEA